MKQILWRPQKSQPQHTHYPWLSRKNSELLHIFFLPVLCAGHTSKVGTILCTIGLVPPILFPLHSTKVIFLRSHLIKSLSHLIFFRFPPLAYQRNILSKTHAALPIWRCPAFIILPNFSPQFCNMAMLTTQMHCVHMAKTSHPLLPLLGETCPSNIRMMTYLSGLRSGKPSPRKLYLIHPFIVQTDCPLSIFPQCTTVTHIMAIYHIVL